jgi:Zn-dependent peptidase ImmA (M78 family)
MSTLPQGITEKFANQYPVPVIAIANELGISVFESVDFANGEAGLIRKEEDGSYAIYLNALDAPTRQRFTIAHEIGHFILHKDLLDKGEEFVDNIKQPFNGVLHRTTGKPHQQEERKREVEANEFAANLLMPGETFKSVWNQNEVIEPVAEYFNVSSAAATIRAKDLLGLVII